MNRQQAKLFLLLLLSLFIGCAKPMTSDELINLNHIPDTLRNAQNVETLTFGAGSIETDDSLKTFLYMFDDIELKKVLDMALTKNSDLLTLESKVRQARAEAAIRGADMYPSVDLGLDYNYSDGSYKAYSGNSAQNALKLSASFSWELDIFGKLNSLRKASKEQVLYAEQNLAHGQVSLIADAAGYYFNIRDIANSITLSNEIIKNLQIISDIAGSKYNLGLVDEKELLDALMDVSSERNNLRSLEIELEKSRNALLVLIDANELPFDSTVTYSMRQPKVPEIDTIPGAAIMNRPDIKSSVYTLNSEIYKRNSSKAALYPAINISGNIGQILASSSGVGDLLWQIAASLTAPIFNRKELYEQLKIQNENVRQSEYALQKIINTALGEIENSIFQADRNRIIFINSKEFLANTEKVFTIITNKYDSGLTDNSDFLQYRNRTLEAEKLLNKAETGIITAYINLYKAFGGAFSASGKKG